MTEADLTLRTKAFSVRVLRLCAALPNTMVGRLIVGQLGRAGTSVGANYRAACKGRSKAEFVAKLGIVEEEVDESAYWMELIMEERILPEKKVQPLHQEAQAIERIAAASRTTALRRMAPIANRKSQIANA